MSFTPVTELCLADLNAGADKRRMPFCPAVEAALLNWMHTIAEMMHPGNENGRSAAGRVDPE